MVQMLQLGIVGFSEFSTNWSKIPISDRPYNRMRSWFPSSQTIIAYNRTEQFHAHHVFGGVSLTTFGSNTSQIIKIQVKTRLGKAAGVGNYIMGRLAAWLGSFLLTARLLPMAMALFSPSILPTFFARAAPPMILVYILLRILVLKSFIFKATTNSLF